MATTAAHVWRPSGARRIVLDGFAPVPRGTLADTPSPLAWPAKDPADVLDYEFDVAAALTGNRGDSIATLDVAITPDATGDLTMSSAVADGPVATIYVAQITITTTSGRTISRAVLLPVQSLATATAPTYALTTDTGAAVTDQNGNPILIGS